MGAQKAPTAWPSMDSTDLRCVHGCKLTWANARPDLCAWANALCSMRAEGDVRFICPEGDCKRLYSSVQSLRKHCQERHPQARVLTYKRSSSVSTAEVLKYQEQFLRVFRDGNWTQDTSGSLQLPNRKVRCLLLPCVCEHLLIQLIVTQYPTGQGKRHVALKEAQACGHKRQRVSCITVSIACC